MGRAADHIPALKFGHRIYPENIAGQLGLPSVGEIFYVDPGSGSDTANAGKRANDAFATVTKALSAMTADQDDVCIIAGTSSTGRTTEVAAIDWNKRRTHIIGNGPLRKIVPRNGIAFSAAVSTPCFTVSATNCSFTNITIATFEDINVLVNVTAAYNTFNYVHFQGIGHADAGDDAAARSIVITGADENLFINCTIGLDTVTRGGAANASVELTGTCARTQFINCDFPIYADGNQPNWIKANVGNCYERFLKFEHCMFMNPTVVGGSTTLTEGMDTHATGNGTIVLDGCGFLGMTNVADDFTAVHSINTATVPTAATATFMQVLA